jgi:hypothetical protein
MKIYHITEAPRIEPKISGIGTEITGTKAAFANKNGSVSKGTIVGPAKNGNPNQVSFKDSKGKTFNVSIKKLLDPKKLTPLNIGLGTSTTTAAPKADAPSGNTTKVKAPKAVPSNIDGGGEAELKARLDKIEADMKKASSGFFKKWLRRIMWLVRKLGLGAVGSYIQVALNVPQLEDAFDAYLRSLVKAGMTDPSRCKTIGSIATADGGVPLYVARAYRKVVSLTTELIFEVFVGFFTAASTPAAIAVASALFIALGVSSGGTTVVLSIIAGGAWLIGGPELIRRCLDALGVQEKLENFVGSTFLGLEQSCRWARALDRIQELGNLGAGITGGALTTVGIPDFTSGMFGESATIVEEKSSSAIKSDLEKIIKSDPEILAAYKKGKKLLPKFKAKLKAD